MRVFVFALLWFWSAATLSDINIVASGQSNVSQIHYDDWSPEPNLYVWNMYWHEADHLTLGNTFEAAPTSFYTTSMAYANEVAKANPDEPVNLVSVAWGNKSISHWLDSESNPYMMSMLRRNVLESGMGDIDQFFWWQGESDVGNGDYARDYQRLEAKLTRTMSFSNEAIFVIVTPNPSSNGGKQGFDNIIMQIRRAEAKSTRRFVISPRHETFSDGIHIDTQYVIPFLQRVSATIQLHQNTQ